MSYSGVEYQCEDCQQIYFTSIGISKCPSCGKQNDVTSENSKTGMGNYFSSEKYPVLRTIADFYKYLAYGVGVIVIISFIAGIANIEDNRELAVILLLGSIIVGPIVFITLLAYSEGIMLFVNMADDLSKVKMSLDDQ